VFEIPLFWRRIAFSHITAEERKGVRRKIDLLNSPIAHPIGKGCGRGQKIKMYLKEMKQINGGSSFLRLLSTVIYEVASNFSRL